MRKRKKVLDVVAVRGPGCARHSGRSIADLTSPEHIDSSPAMAPGPTFWTAACIIQRQRTILPLNVHAIQTLEIDVILGLVWSMWIVRDGGTAPLLLKR